MCNTRAALTDIKALTLSMISHQTPPPVCTFSIHVPFCIGLYVFYIIIPYVFQLVQLRMTLQFLSVLLTIMRSLRHFVITYYLFNQPLVCKIYAFTELGKTKHALFHNSYKRIYPLKLRRHSDLPILDLN